MNVTPKVIGLDIAESVFVAVGRDAHGKVVWKHTCSRSDVLGVFADMPVTTIGIEACAGSHYWAPRFNAMGHDTKLIACQHTRAYVTGNKNDMNNAAAIAGARSRASTKYVAVNTESQHDLQMLHRARQALPSWYGNEDVTILHPHGFLSRFPEFTSSEVLTFT